MEVEWGVLLCCQASICVVFSSSCHIRIGLSLDLLAESALAYSSFLSQSKTSEFENKSYLGLERASCENLAVLYVVDVDVDHKFITLFCRNRAV